MPLLISLFAFTIVQAQNPAPKMRAIKPGTSVGFKNGRYFIKPPNDSGIVRNGISLPAKKKPGVYRLQQDGMPCIVPDTKDIAAMPNAFKGEAKVPFLAQPPRIPNAAAPKTFPNNTNE